MGPEPLPPLAPQPPGPRARACGGGGRALRGHIEHRTAPGRGRPRRRGHHPRRRRRHHSRRPTDCAADIAEAAISTRAAAAAAATTAAAVQYDAALREGVRGGSTAFPAAAVAAGLAHPPPRPRSHTGLRRVAASTPLPSRLSVLRSRGPRGEGVSRCVRGEGVRGMVRADVRTFGRGVLQDHGAPSRGGHRFCGWPPRSSCSCSGTAGAALLPAAAHGCSGDISLPSQRTPVHRRRWARLRV
jgi:hypothetical protein